MAWKGYHFRLLGSTNPRRTYFAALKAFMVAQGWELHDQWGETKAEYYFTAVSTVLNNETFTIGNKIYTFKTTLTPAEGEVLIGANYTASMTNMALALNRTDPGTNDGVKYKVAAANEHFELKALAGARIDIVALTLNEDYNIAPHVPAETLSNSGVWTRSVWATENQVVYKSRGESGKEPYGYIHLYNCSSGTYLQILPYQYWDATAHTGTRIPTWNNVSNYRLSAWATTYDCLIAGDKDLLYTYSNFSAVMGSVCGFQMGHLPVRGIPDLIETTNAIVAGSAVSIPVTDSSKVPGIGGYFQIVGFAGEGCDRLQVASKPDATHVVVVTLPRNYASGAILGQPASTFGALAPNNNWPDYSWRPCSYPTDVGLTVSANVFSAPTAINMTTVSSFSGKIGMTPLYFALNGLVVLGMIDKGVFYTAGFTTWDVAAMNNDGSIVTANMLATSATASTIVDSTKSWTANEHVGKFVITVGGTGLNQVRKITANTATTLTIEQDWGTTPDGTTTFRIYDQIYRLHANFPWYVSCATLVTETKIPS